MNCPSCQAENRAEARFCDGCGSPMVRRCASCDHELRAGARFCDGCGTATSTAAAQAASVAPEPPPPALPTPPPTPATASAASRQLHLGGRYEVERLLGEGAKKRVFLARDTSLGRDVALALIKTEGLDDASRVRVQREAKAMGQLGDHPHVVTVHDIAEENGQIYIVSQFMRGGSVEDRINAAPGRRLLLDDALRIADEVCQALAHAHERGVIHRDLKPGNVWLDEEGTAALGDFGLAVSLDRTRVTQEGMMVGTVAYMAPEQAVGQTPDPRGDLYALGVTLYEMLTGRPPFVGDDAVAIISQHLNTPPVAPSWHNEEIPRALDALLLKLLAKTPDERVQSAAEVRDRLSDLRSAREGGDVSIADSANPLDALAAGVFVGRDEEVARLRAGIDDAFSGRGRVQLLVGEPGIGKTRTSEELATYAKLRGAEVLWGRCYEGEGAPTYWPWIQLIRSYVGSRDAAELLSELGAGASAIADVVSEVRERIPGLQPAPPLEPENARFRLFDSLAGFLRRVAARQPLLLVLDDLHWADKPSLLLLQFVTRDLEGARILVLGTYRDVELGRTHPLADTLAELARSGSPERVVLRGLTEDDVGRFIELSTGQPPPAGLAAGVFRETEGNPFFVNEVVRLLVSEGRLEDLDDRASWSLSIPQGIREVVGRRLSALSEPCNEILTLASVIGREFDLPVLAAASDLDEEATLERVDEAVSARLVEELPGTQACFRFSHALVRETLYEELSTTRRVRLHRKIADVMEQQYAGNVEGHLAQIAHHAVEGAHGGGDVEKAIRYAKQAGERAMTLFAYEDAAPHFDRALQTLELLPSPDPLLRCDLLTELGWSLSRAVDRVPAAEALREAVEIARAQSDPHRLARAASGLTFATHVLGEPTPECVANLQEALEGLGDEVCYERVNALRALEFEWNLGPTNAQAQEIAEECVAVARELGNPEELGRALIGSVASRWGFDSLEFREERAAEIVALGREASDAGLELGGLTFQRVAALERGDRAAIERIYEQEKPLLERTQDVGEEHWHMICSATRAILDADWAAAEKLAGEALAFGQRVIPEFAQQMFGVQISAVLRARNQLELLMGVLEQREKEHPQPAWRCALAAIYAALDREEQMVEILEEMIADDFAAVPDDANLPGALALLAEACCVSWNEHSAPLLYEKLAPHPRRVINLGAMASIYGSTSDYLGRLAAVMGRYDEALQHMQESLEILERLGARMWIASNRQYLAEILVHRDAPGDRERAIELLNESIELGRRYDCELVVSRSLALKLELQGVESGTMGGQGTIHTVHTQVQQNRPDFSPHAGADGNIVIVFSDMEGFTAMTERLGDRAAHEVVRRHNGVVRKQLADHGGVEVELQGDGFLLAFSNAVAATRCAIGIQREFAAQNEGGAHNESIRVRIGLHAGQAIRDKDKFFGRTVILAARIADQAVGGVVLASAELKALVDESEEFDFKSNRQVDLKGISETQEIFEVAW